MTPRLGILWHIISRFTRWTKFSSKSYENTNIIINLSQYIATPKYVVDRFCLRSQQPTTGDFIYSRNLRGSVLMNTFQSFMRMNSGGMHKGQTNIRSLLYIHTNTIWITWNYWSVLSEVLVLSEYHLKLFKSYLCLF